MINTRFVAIPTQEQGLTLKNLDRVICNQLALNVTVSGLSDPGVVEIDLGERMQIILGTPVVDVTFMDNFRAVINVKSETHYVVYSQRLKAMAPCGLRCSYNVNENTELFELVIELNIGPQPENTVKVLKWLTQ